MAAELIAKASWYILENAGRVAAMEFHREVGTLSNSSAASVVDIPGRQLAASSVATLTEKAVRAAYDTAVANYQDKKRRQQQETQDQALLAFDELKSSMELDQRLDLARQYTRRLGLTSSKGPHAAGTFFVNGKLFPLNEVRLHYSYLACADSAMNYRNSEPNYSRPCKRKCSTSCSKFTTMPSMT